LFPHTLHRRRITMATVAITRVVLPAVIAAFFASALVLPALRHRLRTRSWGVVVHREGDPYQRVLGVAMALFPARVVLWTVLYDLLAPALLGVWPAPAWLAWAGAALAAAGIGVTALAQAQMGLAWRIGIDDRPTALVTAGLYRLVRNPIYAGMLLMVT